MGLLQPFFRGHFQKLQFRIQHIFPWREARPVGEAEHMRIYGDGRLIETLVQDHIGGFTTDPGKASILIKRFESNSFNLRS